MDFSNKKIKAIEELAEMKVKGLEQGRSTGSQANKGNFGEKYGGYGAGGALEGSDRGAERGEGDGWEHRGAEGEDSKDGHGERDERERDGKGHLQHENVSLVPKNNIESVITSNDAVLGNNQLAQGKKVEEKRRTHLRQKKFELVSVSLILGYNQIRSVEFLPENVMKIKGIPSNFTQNLMWIDLQHNYLTSIPRHGFECFENLKSLYLHCNYIVDLKEIENLNGLEHLRNLTIHGNPVDRIPHFRLITLAILPWLKKLDTVLYSKKERDNALYISKMKHVREYTKCLPEDIEEPPELENNKNTKDDNSISY